jgi:sugar O-acyltransferase (sialic acid O-acetyltransferase NeuD family)
MKRLTLIGTKEFAEQIIFFAKRTGEFEFVGYFDEIEPTGNIINGFPVLGKVDDAIQLYQEGKFDCIFIAVGYTRFDLREEFYNRLKGKVPFANIICSSVFMGENVVLGEGIFIGDNTYIDDNTIIEDNVFIHVGSTLGHNNRVGKHTYISGRFDTCGNVTVGDRCFIGVRCLVSDGISICDDSWVGIGSLVLKDITQPGKYMPNVRLMRIDVNMQ